MSGGDHAPDVADVARCLSPDPTLPASRAEAFRGWVAPRVAGWRRAGLAPPERGLNGAAPPPGTGWVHLATLASPAETGRAAAWAATASFGPAARDAARRLLTDCLGIGAAAPLPAFPSGREAPPVLDDVLDVLDAFDAPQLPRVSLWREVRGRRRAGLWSAILWNRISGDPRELHVGPECVAAAVAAAEWLDRSLDELLGAVAAACGIAAWHRDLAGRAMERRGIHPPGALAPVASAAAVARLARLPPEDFAEALRTADLLTPLHPYAAFREGAGLKLVYGAWGQFLGAAAVLGPRIPGSDAVPRPAPHPAPDERPDPPRDLRFRPEAAGQAVLGVTFKKYPGSRALQPTLAALDALGPVPTKEIDRIEVITYPYAAALTAAAEPARGAIAAQMHLPTAVALRLLAEDAGHPLRAADYARANRRETLALAARVRVTARRFGASDGPVSQRVRRARVRILLRGGEVLSAERGNAWAPPPPGAIRDRFRRFRVGSSVRDPASLPSGAPARAIFATRTGGPR